MQRLLFPLTDGYGRRSVFFKAQIFLLKVAANKTKSWSIDIVCMCVYTCVGVCSSEERKILNVFLLSSEKGLKGKEISFGPFLFNTEEIENTLLYKLRASAPLHL